MHGKLDWAGHHQLLAGVFGDRAADFAFIEGDVIEFILDCTQRGADARRTSANDHHVIDAGNRARASQGSSSPDNRVDAISPLIDSVFYQSQAAEFADDEHILDGSLVFRR